MVVALFVSAKVSIILLTFSLGFYDFKGSTSVLHEASDIVATVKATNDFIIFFVYMLYNV